MELEGGSAAVIRSLNPVMAEQYNQLAVGLRFSSSYWQAFENRRVECEVV